LERRLATILAIDVVGYSQLMRLDEEATLQKLIELRLTLDRLAALHGGRTFGVAGDSMLAEFQSPVEAVRCSFNIQNSVADLNENLPVTEQMRLRIGVNLGDVMAEGDSLYGDGVNVAARMESLSDPDGICVSGAVYEQVRDQLKISFNDIGEQSVKNINRSVQAWKWPAVGTAQTDTNRRILKTIVGHDFSTQGDALEPKRPNSLPRLYISQLRTVYETPDAVEVAETIFESLVVSLSPRVGLIVATGETHRQHADFELSGRVSEVNGQMRVFIKLTKAETGVPIYAEDWKVPVRDAHSLPNLITEKTASILRIHMIAFEGQEFLDQKNAKLSNQELLSKAAYHMSRYKTHNWQEARCALELAVERDPDNPISLAMLAAMATQMIPFIPFDSIPDKTEHVMHLANKAVELGPRIDFVLRARGNLRLWLLGDHQGCRIDCERSLAVNPTFHLTQLTLATSEILSGQPTEGISRMERMMSLATTELQFPLFVSIISLAHILLGNEDDAFEFAREGHERNPSGSWNALVYAAAAAGQPQIVDTCALHKLVQSIELPFSHFRHMPFTDKHQVEMLEERLRSVDFTGNKKFT
jgi:class 3 adenylate cyclase/TolB-like protein